ncbi:hypothetical protein [Azospirillum halopraeferens]|uniref:hypothetical protein n=1 Tax=Azospirillum halopraeferens TaxID=34010 RepID=UPI00040014AC|nr:hypothetical protein [Azospirillum halopraeferens]
MSEAAIGSDDAQSPLVAYKRILQRVLNLRPSGTRQRLAEAIGKNRSFVSQMASPGNPTPVPAQHLEQIFEICHFAPADRDSFLAAYRLAHPRRLRLLHERHRTRRISVEVPDLEDADRNRKLDAIVTEFAARVAQLLHDD